MKTKTIINYIVLTMVSVALVIFGCRCATSQQDPLAGFHIADPEHLGSYNIIFNDYQDYIQKIPPDQKGYVGTVFFHENAAGQHAVSIEIFEKNENASWMHVLFYDKDNKRIKAIKYDHMAYKS